MDKVSNQLDILSDMIDGMSNWLDSTDSRDNQGRTTVHPHNPVGNKVYHITK